MTATNMAGSRVAQSAVTPPIGATPTNTDDGKPFLSNGSHVTLAPVDSGFRDQAFWTGWTLVANKGNWLRATSWAYAWQRCTAAGAACAPIAGATAATYLTTADDRGHKLSLQVTATGVNGTKVETSTAVGPIVDRPAHSATGHGEPELIDRSNATPRLRAVDQRGFVLSAEIFSTTGDWVGAPTLTVAWQRCAADGTGCVAIAGATGPSYRVAVADVGKTLRTVVTATSSLGTATANSLTSPVVITHR